MVYQRYVDQRRGLFRRYPWAKPPERHGCRDDDPTVIVQERLGGMRPKEEELIRVIHMDCFGRAHLWRIGVGLYEHLKNLVVATHVAGYVEVFSLGPELDDITRR